MRRRLSNLFLPAPCSQTLSPDWAYVVSISITPDGSLMASGSPDRTVRIWNARTGIPLQCILHGHDHVISVDCTRSGDYLALSNRGWKWTSNYLELWSLTVPTATRSAFPFHMSWVTIS